MISTADQEKLTEIMQAMGRHELALSDLYRPCAAASPADEAFWVHLAQMEVRHAENLQRMIAAMKAKPERFEMGRPFNLTALQTATDGLRENIQRIAQAGIPPLKMLILARDIEQSVLESRYGEIVKTFDVEYQTLIKAVIDQTYDHKKAIQQQIEQTQKAP